MQRKDAPNLDTLSSINADGSHRHIQPADVRGRFVTWRLVVYAALIAIYVALPFIEIGGHPAVQLDIETRRFYLFGAVFNAQDFWRAVFLILTGAIGLVFVTALWGRVWCGWACPQTVFLEGVYRRIERWFEGPREARYRLERAPWTARKVAVKGGKHLAFALVSLLLAHVFIAFFVSLPSLLAMVREDPRENWTAFLWVMAIAALLYGNFAWFREQMCIVLCPYGRLQSALIDRDSLIIGYDSKRGEPRGKLTRADRAPLRSLPVLQPGTVPLPAPAPAPAPALSLAGMLADPAAAAAALAPPAPHRGECVDCNRCVVVCPTGIDIRNGLQLECIGCAQCIDACDEVAQRLGRGERGLIGYTSENKLAGQPQRTVRPRVVVYGALLAAMTGALAWATFSREPVEANVLRVRGAPYVLTGGKVMNQFELHLVNKNAVDSVLHVDVTSPVPVELTLPAKEVKLESLGHYRLPVIVRVSDADFPGPFELDFAVRDEASQTTRHVSGRFLGPQRKR